MAIAEVGAIGVKITRKKPDKLVLVDAYWIKNYKGKDIKIRVLPHQMPVTLYVEFVYEFDDDEHDKSSAPAFELRFKIKGTIFDEKSTISIDSSKLTKCDPIRKYKGERFPQYNEKRDVWFHEIKSFTSDLLYLKHREKRFEKKNSFFTIQELCKTRYNNLDNTPSKEVEDNLQALIDNVLNPAREEYGNRIYVTSGYRSLSVNKAVGGAVNSQHTKGQAADLQTGKGKTGNKALFDIIRKQGNFDQLINEKDYSWIHVSYNPNRNRRKVLEFDGTNYITIQSKVEIE